jgi:hypothetical protein
MKLSEVKITLNCNGKRGMRFSRLVYLPELKLQPRKSQRLRKRQRLKPFAVRNAFGAVETAPYKALFVQISLRMVHKIEERPLEFLCARMTRAQLQTISTEGGLKPAATS